MFPKEDRPCAFIIIWDHITFLTLVMLDGKEIQMSNSSFFIFLLPHLVLICWIVFESFECRVLKFFSYNYEDITAIVFKSFYSTWLFEIIKQKNAGFVQFALFISFLSFSINIQSIGFHKVLYQLFSISNLIGPVS